MQIKIVALAFILIQSLFPTILLCQCRSIPYVFNTISVVAEFIDKKHTYYQPKVKYVGPYKDSIYVGMGSQITAQLESRKVTRELKSRYENLKQYDGKISVKVCETNFIKSVNNNNLDIPKSEVGEFMKVGYYLPVIITNIDNVPINIALNFGHSSLIPLVLEVQQSDKSWKPFTECFICWTGPKYIYINPEEIVVVLMPVFKENENRNIRFVIGKDSSNAIIQRLRL